MDKSRDNDVDFDFFDSPVPDSKDSQKLKKIEAKVPTVVHHESSDSDSETDERESGRRAPSPRTRNKARGKTTRKHSKKQYSSSSSSYTDTDSASDRSSSRSRSSSDPRDRNAKSEVKWASKVKPRVSAPKENDNTRPRIKKHVHHNPKKKSYSDSESSSCSSSFNSSDSDITDVSPLASPKQSSRSSERRKIEFADMPSHRKSPSSSRPSSAHSSDFNRLLRPDNDSMNLKLLMHAVMEMEKQRSASASPHDKVRPHKQFSVPQGRLTKTRKNISFPNQKLKEIDRENTRLMKEILNYATMGKDKKNVA